MPKIVSPGDLKVRTLKALDGQSMLWLLGNNPPQEDAFFARLASQRNAIRSHHRTYNALGYQKNREKNVVYARSRRIAVKQDPIKLEAYRKYCREKMAERLRSDPEFRIRFRMRNRIWMSLQRGVAKKGPTVEMLGCSMSDYRRYLEARWLPGMSWDNYGRGGWHIDHKRALAKFDLQDPEERKMAFHYTNTQPLWERDNLSKGDTV